MASGYGPVTAGNPGVAADANDYWAKQAVMVYASAAARSADAALTSALREGMVSFLLDTNTLAVYSGSAWSTIGPVHGALTAWTPALTQNGAVTSTNNRAVYQRIGRWIMGTFDVSATATGSATQVVNVSLPVTAASAAAGVVGSFEFLDASSNDKQTGSVVLDSTSVMSFRMPRAGNAENRLGLYNFTAALASGDRMSASFMFEAAADA